MAAVTGFIFLSAHATTIVVINIGNTICGIFSWLLANVMAERQDGM